jgi:hypothetical protein
MLFLLEDNIQCLLVVPQTKERRVTASFLTFSNALAIGS